MEKETIVAQKPEYLDEAFINIRACCPNFMFNYCPCLLCSCFSTFFNCMIGCALQICSPCLKGSASKICSSCLKLIQCFKGCASKICSSCLK